MYRQQLERRARWGLRRARSLAIAATSAGLVVTLAGCTSGSQAHTADVSATSSATPSVIPSTPAPPATTSLSDVVPKPVSVRPSTSGGFQITAHTIVWVPAGSPQALDAANVLVTVLRRSTGFPLPVHTTSATSPQTGIDLLLSGAPSQVGDQGYQLTAGTQHTVIAATTPAGLFNGVQTLRQVLPARVESATTQTGPWVVPGGSILDYPRYAYRGAMLDVARHFFTVAQVERYIDEISLYKINYLHLHMSDDQGWRIAINGWPRLTSVGSTSAVGGSPGGFYTQAQYKQLVAYAAAHGVTVVPEIDMPSHTNAAIASYGQLNCSGKPSSLYTGTDVGFIALCTDKAETYTFVSDVLRQLAAMTPGPYLHIGGDESKTLTTAQYSSFFGRVQPIVHANGKTAIIWGDAAVAPLASSTVLEYWNTNGGASQVEAAAARGTKLIMAPATHAYLDQKYNDKTPLGFNWAANIEVEDAYNWDPATLLPGVPSSSVLGVEAPLWSETLLNSSDIEYMAFPRLPAIAELGWSPESSHSWSDFRMRLATQGPRWTAMGVNFYRSPQVPWSNAGS